MKSFISAIAASVFLLTSFAANDASAQDIGIVYHSNCASIIEGDVDTKLAATNLYTSVTLVTMDVVPTLAALSVYDVLLVTTGCSVDGPALGDVLADYIDQGGRVVMHGLAFSSTLSIGGRYLTDYAPLLVSANGSDSPPGLTLVPVLANDPLLAGVVSFAGGTAAFRSNGAPLAAGAEIVANWSDGEALVVKRTVGAVRNVALNFYPGSSDIRGDLWDATTDGVRLMTNAIDWVYAGCGNGIVDAGEDCDDGNADNTDDCLDTCVFASCGDGFVQVGVEECEDGNVDNTDACLDTCLFASCGDGFVEAGVEECDDGNLEDTDACLNTCVAASCGDGFVQTGVEECDDANDVDTDACVAGCLNATCGDGFLQDTVEECDDGADNSDDVADACRTTCLLPVPECGNGIVEADEECDGGEGCEADCTATDEDPNNMNNANNANNSNNANNENNANNDPNDDPFDSSSSDSGCCATHGAATQHVPLLMLLLGLMFVRRRRSS